MENSKAIKKYFDKYFKQQFFKEADVEFKELLKILNRKDKQVKNSVFLADFSKCTLCKGKGEYIDTHPERYGMVTCKCRK